MNHTSVVRNYAAPNQAQILDPLIFCSYREASKQVRDITIYSFICFVIYVTFFRGFLLHANKINFFF